MAELKTKSTGESVEKFLKAVPDEQQREDCFAVLKLIKKVTKATPKMWGPAIIGFCDYKYKYKDGKEMDWFMVGFSPRKQSLVLYVLSDFPEKARLLRELGKHKVGNACLYIKKLDDIKIDVLEKLVTESVKATTARSRASD